MQPHLSFLLCAATLVSAQTYTQCNPLKGTCDPNPALGRKINIDFANEGPSSSLTRTGSATIVYDSDDGALFTVSGSGHNPTLQSKFYIMFGKLTVTARASPGAGVVSSIVLQSDDLDEIDIEFVGNDPSRVQTNYFSKGDTTSWDRGKYHKAPGGSVNEEFHTYTIDWTADYIKWYIDETLVRSLHSVDRPDTFPQTPMSLRIGSWAAGDSTYNLPGTIEWAGGTVDYAHGPYIYAVKTIKVEDYSAGTNYEYTDQSGSWTSIKAHNGQIGASGPVSRNLFQHLVKLGAIFGTAFFADIGFNRAVDAYFDKINAGKQWKDIRGRYIQAGDDDEDDDE